MQVADGDTQEAIRYLLKAYEMAKEGTLDQNDILVLEQGAFMNTIIF